VRIAVVVMAAAGVASCADASLQPGPDHDRARTIAQAPAGTPHDFDFEHGRWRTSLRRLLQPLSGSRQWADYTGTTTVHPLLGGRANLVELEVAGPLGRIDGVSLRLFDTQRQRWTLNYSSVTSGTLPTVQRYGLLDLRTIVGITAFSPARATVQVAAFLGLLVTSS